MNRLEKITLSDTFDEWRNKINASLEIISKTDEKIGLLNTFPLIPEGSQVGLLLTNDNENNLYWRDAEILFKELGITLEKDEESSEDISGTTITTNKINTSSLSCTGTLTTNYLTVNKNISCKGNISSTGTITSSNTITGKTIISKSSLDGQGINLSYTKPYIKFYFNRGTSVTSNITENKSGVLTINANEFSSTGSVIRSDLRLRTTKNDVIFKNNDSSFSIKFAGVGEGENTLNPFSIKLSSGVVTLENGIYSDLRILPTLSSENKSLIIRNKENKAQLLISDSLTGNPNSLTPLSIDMTNGNVYTKSIHTENLLTTENGKTVEILKNGRIYNAVWNDYAEFFERGEKTEPGDIIALDVNSDKEHYIKATNPRLVVGVHSDTYGHILGGSESIEESEKTHIPVGLTGRVKTKIIGSINKGDEVVLSTIPGVGRKFNPNTDRDRDIIGFVVEDNLLEDIKLVKMKLK